MMRYRVLVIGLILGQVLFKLLTFAVGLLLCSALGLLIVQQFWLAVMMLTVALLVYEGGYWLLVGRWVR